MFEVQDSMAACDDTSGGATPGPKRRSRKMDKRFNGRIIEKMVEENRGKDQLFNGVAFVYDFEKNLYTNKQLNSSNEIIRVEVKTKEFEQQREVVYMVTMQHVTKIELNPNSHVLSLPAVQFVDIALRYGPSRDRIPVGNEIFFRSPEKRVSLYTKNKEVAFGFYQSARNSEAGLMLNVDRATTLFHIGDPLLAVFEKCIRNVKQMPRIDTKLIRDMTKDLHGTRMRLVHLPHFIIRVNQFTELAACEIKFPLADKAKDGKVISKRNVDVAEYYKEKYNSKGLEFPNFPCVVTGDKNNPKYYPIELCELLADQYVTKLLPPALQRKMSQETTKEKPNGRFFGIIDSLGTIMTDGKRFMTEFGFSVNRNLVKLSGRVIPSPNLKYGDEVVFKDTSQGEWVMQIPEPKKFFDGVVITKWIIAELSIEDEWLPKSFVDEFQRKLMKTAKKMGVTMSAPLSGEWNRHDFVDIENLKAKIFQTVLKEVPDLQLILFIIPDVDGCYYGTKKLADLDFGIATQCCNKKQGDKMLQVSYVSNLMLKINAKMNGVNWILDVNWNKNKKIMFVGVDVTHPSPGNNESVSIASVVGSYDNTFARYDTVLSVQEETRCETVDLHSSIEKLLQ
ncbi:protein argonaute-2-like protein, partial [Leptotrombidium deliense]